MKLPFFHLGTLSVSVLLAGCGSGGSGGGKGNPLDEPPAGVKIKKEHKSNRIIWKGTAGIEYYRVYYGTSSGISKKDAFLKDVFGKTAIDHPCKVGKTYYYRVSANTEQDSSGLSKEVSAKCDAIPKDGPKVVQAEGGDGKATIYFSEVDGAKSYNLYYGKREVISIASNKVKNISSPFVLTGLDNNARYNFRVSAISTVGETLSNDQASTVPGKRLNRKQLNTQLTDLAFDNGKFLISGTGGGIFSTSDGLNLSQEDSGTENDLLSIAVDDSGNFMVVGTQTILVSKDGGSSWEKLVPAYDGYFLRVRYLNGNFVILELNGKVLSTSDLGKTWNISNIGNKNNIHYLKDVAYGAGFYVVTGQVYNNGSGMMARSKDLVSWTVHEVGSSDNDTQAIVFNGSTFVVQDKNNKTHTSTDAKTWTESDCGGICPTFYQIIWDGSKYIGFGEDIDTSPDGITWTEANDNGSLITYGGRYNGSNLYIAVGNDMFTAVSNDGVTWTEDSDKGTIPENLIGISSDGTYLVAIGDEGGVYTSTDGNTWTAETSGVSVTLNDLTYCAGGMVAVGENDTIIYSASPYTSWSGGTGASSPSPLGDTTNLVQVACHGNVAVIGGTGVATSAVIFSGADDLSSWTGSTGYAGSTSAGQTLKGISVGDDGSAVTFNELNSFSYSSVYSDANTWTSGTENLLSNCTGEFAENEYVCISSSAAAYSPDMINWSSFSFNFSDVNKAVPIDDYYLMLGYYSFMAHTDASTFGNSSSITPIGSSGTYVLRDAVKFGNKIVVVGDDGYVAAQSAANLGL